MRRDTSEKNLLLIVPMLHQGGFERVCVETARLMQKDYHVTLLIFTDEDAFYDVSGIDVVNLNLPARDGKIAKAWNLFQRVQKIKRIKKERQIDISYSFGATANLANAYSRAGDLVVTSLRSSLDFDDRARMERVLKGSDLMISCSAQMERTLRAQYGFTKTALLYNPLDTERIVRQAAMTCDDIPFADERRGGQKPVVIVTMGREDNAKGYWHLIKAFSVLHKSREDARLVIIGDGTFAGEKQLARDLGFSDEVVFTGAKKNPFPYLAAGDLFVLSSNHEGFPNVVIEACACHLPVIATDCRTGPREILLSDEEYAQVEEKYPDGVPVRDVTEGAYGMLIPDMTGKPDYDATHLTPDDHMLASAMKRMLSDPARMKRYREGAAARAAHFSTERYREALMGILERR